MRVRSAPIVVFLRIRIVIFRSRLRLPPRVVFDVDVGIDVDVDDAIDFAADIVEQPNEYIFILSILFYHAINTSWFYWCWSKKILISPKKKWCKKVVARGKINRYVKTSILTSIVCCPAFVRATSI